MVYFFPTRRIRRSKHSNTHFRETSAFYSSVFPPSFPQCNFLIRFQRYFHCTEVIVDKSICTLENSMETLFSTLSNLYQLLLCTESFLNNECAWYLCGRVNYIANLESSWVYSLFIFRRTLHKYMVFSFASLIPCYQTAN